MGNNKPTNSNPKKKIIPKKKAAPASLKQVREAMWLATARSFGQSNFVIANNKKITKPIGKGLMPLDEYGKIVLPVFYKVRQHDSLYTYGHNYDTTETDCGHYIKQGADSLGIKGFHSYVPDIVKDLTKYGDTTTDPNNIKPGMVMIFADSGYKQDTQHPGKMYAHAALATAVDTLNKVVELSNATLHRDKKGHYMPGTIQPGHLSMTSGKRTETGWQKEGSDFVLAGRLPLNAKNTATIESKLNPVYASHTHQPPAMPPAFTNEWQGSPDAPSYWNIPQPDKYNGPYLPTLQNVSPIHNTKKTGKGGGGGVSVNFNYLPQDTIHSHVVTAPNDIHNKVIEILTSAIADNRIGTDIH